MREKEREGEEGEMGRGRGGDGLVDDAGEEAGLGDAETYTCADELGVAVGGREGGSVSSVMLGSGADG